MRQAWKGTRPHGKPQAQRNYIKELLGQAGGKGRRPMLQLTEAEKAATRKAFESCGLVLPASQQRKPAA